MNFRTENFIEFIRKTKLPIFYSWLMDIGFIGLLILSYFHIYDENQDAFWILLFFLIFGFIGFKLFIYGVNYRVYYYGKQAFNELKDVKKVLISDVKVYIRGFDLFKKKTFFTFDIFVPTYDFFQADIVLTEKSMILFSKYDQFSPILYGIPVEITNHSGLTTLTKANITNWNEKNENLTIKINDHNYTKPLKINFKTNKSQIKEWLTNEYPNQ